jgi:hypothetical protein
LNTAEDEANKLSAEELSNAIDELKADEEDNKKVIEFMSLGSEDKRKMVCEERLNYLGSLIMIYSEVLDMKQNQKG